MNTVTSPGLQEPDQEPDQDDAQESARPGEMSDEEIIAFIRDRESRADRPEISDEQAQAIDYYLRRPFGNEEDGRSQAISSDVFDVVEGLAPILVEPFVDSADLVTFAPQNADDEEAARQESDYINFIATQRNDSFDQLLAWVKAGLLLKNGVVKWWWDTTRRVTIETYRGVTEEALADIHADPEVTIIGFTENPPAKPDPSLLPTAIPGQDPTPGAQAAVQALMAPTYDVRIRRRAKEGCARYAVVPPEELLVIGRDPNIQRATFVQHTTRVTLSDLREMGYSFDDDLSDGGTGDVTGSAVYTARQGERGAQDTYKDESPSDPALREVWFKETYCLLDADRDGVAELRKICSVGSNILARDETEEIPFASWTPYPQLFQWDGRCPADETAEIQDIKSTLWRQHLDNLYTINNNRVFAGKKVNTDDLLDNVIAGVVRVDSDDIGRQVMALPVTPIGQFVLPALEYVDSAKENRTGFTRYNQGNDSDSLNKTATGVRLITQAGNKRIGLMTRCFAEQGVRTLMIGMHGLQRRHATVPETIMLRGQWVQVDPRTWRARYHMTVPPGLGMMDKQMELGSQQELLKMLTGVGTTAGFVTPQNLYNCVARYIQLTGEKNVDKYITQPEKMPQAPPKAPDPKVMLDAQQQQIDFLQQRVDAMNKQRELDQKDRALDQIDQKQGIDARNAQIDALERFHRLQMETEAHVRNMTAPHPQALQAQQQGHQQAVDAAQLAQGQQIDNTAQQPSQPEQTAE